jgi:hypothetical protein
LDAERLCESQLVVQPDRRAADHGADSGPDGGHDSGGLERADGATRPRPQQDGHDRSEQGLAGGNRVHEGAYRERPLAKAREQILSDCGSRSKRESSRTTPSISMGRSNNGAITAGPSAPT